MTLFEIIVLRSCTQRVDGLTCKNRAVGDCDCFPVEMPRILEELDPLNSRRTWHNCRTSIPQMPRVPYLQTRSDQRPSDAAPQLHPRRSRPGGILGAGQFRRVSAQSRPYSIIIGYAPTSGIQIAE